MRWYRCLTGLIPMLLTLTACGPLKALKGPPSDPLEVLGDVSTQGRLPQLRMQPLATGDETPYTPVMLPPDVRRAFVRGHTNAHRDLIGGHWWYVRIDDWSWPVEREDRLTPFSAPSHVPLAPQPAQGQKSDTAQQAPFAAPVSGATTFQQPVPRGTVLPGVPSPGPLPQFQRAPSSRTISPAAQPEAVPSTRKRIPAAVTGPQPAQED
jgi:hypothetical protein